MQQKTEEDLITGLKNNDQLAFLCLYKQFYAGLLYFARGIISDFQESEDIVSNTFTKFYSRRNYFESLQNIKSFLYVTTRNNCFDYLRYKNKKNTFEKQYPQNSPAVEEGIERLRIESEFLRQLYKEIDNLPPKCRQIFELTYFEGKKANEISQLLKISISTVTTQRSRAVKHLRSIFPNKLD
jgi:RNA polymerase sigma-70 factor (family 1)